MAAAACFCGIVFGRPESSKRCMPARIDPLVTSTTDRPRARCATICRASSRIYETSGGPPSSVSVLVPTLTTMRRSRGMSTSPPSTLLILVQFRFRIGILAGVGIFFFFGIFIDIIELDRADADAVTLLGADRPQLLHDASAVQRSLEPR